MTALSIDLTSTGDISARGLIAQIVAFAKERGVDQNALAARAGISAEALSRLKKVGRCRLTTALELARVAGFKTLDFSAQPAGHIAASVSARKLSAGRRLPISAEELVESLASENPRNEHKAHIYGFFEELPIALVHDVILDANLDYKHLSSLATALGTEGETVDWLKEMAGDVVADAA